MVGKMEGAHFARLIASAQYGEDGIETERMFDEGWELTPAVVSKQFDEHCTPPAPHYPPDEIMII